MIRRPPRSTLDRSSAASDVYKRQPYDLPKFRELFGDGSALGMNFSYVEQHVPNGLAQAFVLGESFIGAAPAALILGENIFYGAGLGEMVRSCAEPEGGIIFA